MSHALRLAVVGRLRKRNRRALEFHAKMNSRDRGDGIERCAFKLDDRVVKNAPVYIEDKAVRPDETCAFCSANLPFVLAGCGLEHLPLWTLQSTQYTRPLVQDLQ